jgi:hypothetical protein
MPYSPEAVHVHTRPTLVLELNIRPEPNLLVHAYPVYRRSGVYKREIERVTVIRRHDRRLGIPNMLKPSSYQCRLSSVLT